MPSSVAALRWRATARPRPKRRQATARPRPKRPRPSQTLIALKAPWGIYDAAHWSAADAILPEDSKNGKDVISEGTIKHGSGVGNGAKGDVSFIFGGTTSRLFWPEDSIPTSFTIYSITRYTGRAHRRILQATDLNWVHGHWDNGHIGVAYYEWMGVSW